MLVDTHTHFEKDYYDDYDIVINNAKQNNVEVLIASGCSRASNDEAIRVSSIYSNIFTTIGYHPDQADIITSEDLSYLESQLSSPKVIGIGEIGLDYHYEGYDKNKQKDLFIKQLEMAEKHMLPVVIHSRDAVQDTIDILKKFPNVKGIIHSFSLSKEVANIYISMGYKLGINGVVTFKNCNLRDTLKEIDVESLVLETDSPYMSPEPFRGKKNESKNILIIADYLSIIYNISTDKIAEITSKNAMSVFDIKC